MSFRHTVARESAAVELVAQHHLMRVIATLDGANIPTLLLKGAALAYTRYPAPWCRPYADIDILVPPGTIDHIRTVLGPLGYQSAIEVTSRHITGQWHLHSDIPGARPLDIHERLVNPRAFDALPSFARLFSRSVPLETLGVPKAAAALGAPLGRSARTLSPIDTAWHLMVHAAAHHHGEDRVLDVVDLWLVTREFAAADWRELEDLACASHIAAVCGAGLARLGAIVGAGAPADMIARLREVRGEATAVYTAGRLTVLQVEWSNFRALALRARLPFLLAHMFPPAHCVCAPGDPFWIVPWRYVQRAWRGASAWRSPETWRRRGSSPPAG